MKRLFALLTLATLLSGCPSKEPIQDGGGPNPNPDQVEGEEIAEANLLALDGLPTVEFLARAVPLLAREPSRQSRARLARALDKKYKLSCDGTCRIERK